MENYQMKKCMKALSLAVVAACCAQAAQAADLTVISFGGANKAAQEKAYYAPFTKSTGIKVVGGEYNGEMAKVKAMVDTKSVSWDVVEVESPELARGCDEGMFEKLDYSKIGNKADFVQGAAQSCGVGIFVWSTVLAYNADKLKVGPTGWKDFWDVKKFPGKRGMRKGAKYTLEVALMADGVAPKDVYKVLATPAGVDRAFKKLDQLKPNIQWWEAGAQPPQYLVSGDVVMSSAYNGRIANTQKEGKNLKIVWAAACMTSTPGPFRRAPEQGRCAEVHRFRQQAGKPEGVLAEHRLRPDQQESRTAAGQTTGCRPADRPAKHQERRSRGCGFLG
jgi:putative spermidine/putrescine transport system substrate-binding protein